MADKIGRSKIKPPRNFTALRLDNDFPYNIYGAQQDNSTVKIPSRTADFGILENHWYDVGGGESGWIAPHPENSDIIFAGSYGGFLTRYDHRTGQTSATSMSIPIIRWARVRKR